MREIKFRGLGYGQMHYGNLTIVDGVGPGFGISSGFYINNSAGAPFAYSVDPKTIGQYIGLKDKNGKEIYEGDVVRVINDPDAGPNTEHMQGVGVVYYNESYTCFYWGDFGIFNWGHTESIEVIGNIHEHPHLLTVKK